METNFKTICSNYYLI